MNKIDQLAYFLPTYFWLRTHQQVVVVDVVLATAKC